MTVPPVRIINYFDEYFSFNQLLSIVGLWPLQNKRQRQLICGGLLLSTIFHIITVINAFFYLDSSKIISDLVPVYFFVLGCIIKAINNIYHNEKITIMINRIKDYWDNPIEDRHEIRHLYAKRGRLLGMIFSSLAWGVGIIYSLTPILQKIFVWLNLLEGPVTIQLPFSASLFIKSDKYFTIVYIYCVFTIMILFTLLGAIESLFFAFILHACGMFAEVGWSLENLVSEGNLKNTLNSDEHEDHIFFTIGKIVRKHNEAIEFCKLLEASYRCSFFMIVASNAVMINTTRLQILPSFGRFTLENIFSPTTFVLGQMFCLGFECYISQSIIDHSHAIGDACMKTKWYLMSLRTRKLLNMITMRSRIPCEITAGSFCMSIEFFGDIIKTSMSYFTILHSTE